MRLEDHIPARKYRMGERRDCPVNGIATSGAARASGEYDKVKSDCGRKEKIVFDNVAVF